MKFCLLGADMFHVDGETDIGKDGLNVTTYTNVYYDCQTQLNLLLTGRPYKLQGCLKDTL